MSNVKRSRLQTLICLALFATQMASAKPGQLDSSFGNGGIVVTTFAQDVRPLDAVLQPNDDVIVVGGLNDFVVATEVAVVARYLPNGMLDSSFGVGGVAKDELNNFLNEANAVALQGDGKIVILEHAVGTSNPDGSVNPDIYALVRFNHTGHLDGTFGKGGRVVINIPHPAFFTSVANTLLLQPDQKLLVGGGVFPPYRSTVSPQTVLARYLPSGAADHTFGNLGMVEQVAIGEPAALAVRADGSILAANGSIGTAFGPPTAQFSSTGALVPHVTGGIVTASTHASSVSPIAFLSDGEFLEAVGAQGPFGRHDYDVQVLLVQPNGTVDNDFKSPAFDFGVIDSFTNIAQAIAVGPTGEIAVGGFEANIQTLSGDDFALTRLLSNGSLDAKFGNGGQVIAPLPTGGQVLAILVQPDSKILAIGQAFLRNPSTPLTGIALVRYLTQ